MIPFFIRPIVLFDCEGMNANSNIYVDCPRYFSTRRALRTFSRYKIIPLRNRSACA